MLGCMKTVLVLLVVLAGCANQATIGMCAGEVGTSGDYVVPLDSAIALAYRGDAKHKYFLLVEQSGCHRVLASLPLQREPEGKWYAINFDCSNRQGSVVKGQPIIGLFHGDGGGGAEATWLVEPSKKRFIEVEPVKCNSFS